jgi:hypothetical protein
MSYYEDQLNQIKTKDTQFDPTFKIFANGNGEDTKNISLNKITAKVLIDWLKKNYE